jgi:hypothetical protein
MLICSALGVCHVETCFPVSAITKNLGILDL